MPSGAKKRKAAKKKKVLEAHTNTNLSISTNNPQGNDDLKSQDGKESDGGEVSTPASRDLDSDHNSFNEGNEELEEQDPSSIRSFVAEDKSMEGVPIDVEGEQKIGSEDDGAVKIERELKSDDNSERKNGIFEHIESTKQAHNRDDQSSSSSSSSDDETRVIEKKKEEAYNSVVEASSYDDLVKPVNCSLEEVTQVTENALVGETVKSIAESVPLIDTVESVVSVSKEKIHITESAPVENPVIGDLGESGSKESEKNFSLKLNEAPAVVTDLALKKTEDKVFPLSDETVQAHLNVVESVSNGYEDTILPSSSAPVAATSNGAAYVSDSEIPECSENEPLVAPAPQVVRRTSWLSCCGLFD
ncbi:muscle M-line assembly protein unc-89 [Fagus crenata]